MNPLSLFLADIEPGDVFAQWENLDSGTKQTREVSGAIVLVVLLIVLWAIFLRKPRRRQSGEKHRRHHSPARPNSDEGSGGRRRKWRRRRREHRPRNPTLAETGGLPPIRTEPPPTDLP